MSSLPGGEKAFTGDELAHIIAEALPLSPLLVKVPMDKLNHNEKKLIEPRWIGCR